MYKTMKQTTNDDSIVQVTAITAQLCWTGSWLVKSHTYTEHKRIREHESFKVSVFPTALRLMLQHFVDDKIASHSKIGKPNVLWHELF